MANVGLKSFKHAPLVGDDATTGATYSAAPSKLAGAIEAKVDIELNDAKLYADDTLSDSDTSFVSGKIMLGIDDDDPVVFAPLLGKTLGNDGEVSSTTDDEPIFVGFGYITKGTGTKKYRAKFYPKVKFKEFDTEAKTKEEKMEYVKPSIEGTVYPLANGTWRKENRFTTLAAAITYLDGCFTQATTTP